MLNVCKTFPEEKYVTEYDKIKVTFTLQNVRLMSLLITKSLNDVFFFQI